MSHHRAVLFSFTDPNFVVLLIGGAMLFGAVIGLFLVMNRHRRERAEPPEPTLEQKIRAVETSLRFIDAELWPMRLQKKLGRLNRLGRIRYFGLERDHRALMLELEDLRSQKAEREAGEERAA